MHAIADPRDGFEIAEGHPFLEYYGRLHQWGITVKERRDVAGVDLFASTMIGGRFAIGFDADGELILGVLLDDLSKLLSLTWTSAALVRNIDGWDWVGLSSDETSPDGEEALKVRLFLPMSGQIADAIVGAKSKVLRIRAMKSTSKGKPVPALDNSLELPVTLRGF